MSEQTTKEQPRSPSTQADERAAKRTKLDESNESTEDKAPASVEPPVEQPSSGSSAEASVAVSSDPQTEALKSLPASVRTEVENIFTSGKCRKDEIESCCIDSLRDFSEEQAMAIVKKFQEADLSTVRSKTAFFIGILKRFRKGQGGAGGPPRQGGFDQSQYMNMAYAAMGMGNPLGMMPQANPAMSANPAESAEREQALNTLPPTVCPCDVFAAFVL